MLLRRHHSQVTEVNEEVDYTKLSYNELRSIAKNKGINTHKLSTEDIIEALNKVGD